MQLGCKDMHLIMYASKYIGQPEDIGSDLVDILETAQTFNAKHNVTGMLFCDEGRFIQVLEGEKSTVQSLMDSIQKDVRHENVTILLDHPVENRELSDWSMRAFDVSSFSGKDWSLLDDFRSIYLQNFKVSSSQVIRLLQHFIDDYKTFEKLRV